MATIAFIPVRGGSKSIPLKNIKNIAGHPLIWWSLRACEQSSQISRIVVATDSDEIENVVNQFGFKKVSVYRRRPENALDTSSTESVLLEYLQESTKKTLKPSDKIILVQATNPFTTTADLDQALKLLKKSTKHRSLLSVVRTKRFFWDLKGRPLNYDPARRPRRQDYDGLFMENGAFYISSAQDILKSKNRLTKPILTFEMPEHSGFEIDEPDDWDICETLLMRYNISRNRKRGIIKLFLSDVDGVLTDAGMYYSEKGDELKKFSTYDGMAFKLMQQQGIQVGIVTAENRMLNRHRADKLKMDYQFHGVIDKLKIVSDLLNSLGLNWSNLAYCGDDLNDIEVLKRAGYAFCPSTAMKEVRNIKGIQILAVAGGNGAIREALSYLEMKA